MPTPDVTSPAPYEEGFLLSLMLCALGGVTWLFFPFLPGLFLAVLLAVSTYPGFGWMSRRMRPSVAALLMTALVFLFVLTPVIYLVVATSIRAVQGIHELQSWLGQYDLETFRHVLNAKFDLLPLPDGMRDATLEFILQKQGEWGQQGVQWLLSLFRRVSDNSLAFISSMVLIAFALFFFYRDGPCIVQRIKVLSPLPNYYDNIILYRFGALASVLTMSTVGIALLQGSLFALVTSFMGLPWFYLGVAIAVTSFVPLVGGFIVWAPLVYYLAQAGRTWEALFIVFWGAVVTGFLVDNIVRPMLIRWLTRLQPVAQAGGDLHPLSHTLLTVLATVGGMINFGILGLFFGPMLAAMAITMFDVYELKHGHLLDRS
jgi:predicted PurR-regulated permease PerM